MKNEIKELRHFRAAIRRDVLIDLQSRREVVTDEQVMTEVIQYGNAFMQAEKIKLSNRDRVLWFDIHFGEPAKVGFTWAFNPFRPIDARHNETGFWRMWWEDEPIENLQPLIEVQKEMAAYLVQHLETSH
ncbi:hypothetical protein A0J57_20185 [Sphingobium sp. 22B]|uniref:hypothetical protein n=1 Tax=unclassified Sphingobium TaxID=2611147 RepID=UPI0007862672|nr:MULTISPECIES: hypothetical protein [unclassified Sphingobium]KXU30664.1 hypothetical protein AXW74_16770 [Sphingobium sp. AM]KYC30558.1 hypothetical protein A0J57_20185 [Sphingobium sp. 22B]OAP30277.1 hypothetical protein A8O16_19490 [Sphingobium sp. 20006FA]